MLNVAVEGDVDEAFARRIAGAAGWKDIRIHGRHGKGWLDKNLPRYARAAAFAPWWILRDLDTDADCAPSLVRRLLPGPESHISLRIAVRSVEAWMLADRAGVARFLSVPETAVPGAVEGLDDAKRALLELARSSANREIREGLPPRQGSGVLVGPAYVSFLSEFARDSWDLSAARRKSSSLSGCVRALRNLRLRSAP